MDHKQTEQQYAVVTVSFFRFSSAQKGWAFMQMRNGKTLIDKLPGVQFSRLMGSGKGAGFSFWPNFAVYAIMIVWRDWEALSAFTNGSYLTKYGRHASEAYTILLQPTKAKGQWGGTQPFHLQDNSQKTSVTAVLTRATIRTRKLIRFWRHVPSTSNAIEQAKGRIFSIGIGEWPWVQQATLSIWESEEVMNQYAYQNAAHLEVVRKTRDEQWYAEELFARFWPVATIGTWGNSTVLEPYGINAFSEWPQPSALQAIANA